MTDVWWFPNRDFPVSLFLDAACVTHQGTERVNGCCLVCVCLCYVCGFVCGCLWDWKPRPSCKLVFLMQRAGVICVRVLKVSVSPLLYGRCPGSKACTFTGIDMCTLFVPKFKALVRMNHFLLSYANTSRTPHPSVVQHLLTLTPASACCPASICTHIQYRSQTCVPSRISTGWRCFSCAQAAGQAPSPIHFSARGPARYPNAMGVASS